MFLNYVSKPNMARLKHEGTSIIYTNIQFSFIVLEPLLCSPIIQWVYTNDSICHLYSYDSNSLDVSCQDTEPSMCSNDRPPH